jgi:NDP-sugar pyrophosphorylase family protein
MRPLPPQTPAMRHPTLPFSAMILAGGLGTRLRPVVSDRPKPLALVGGVPFLELLVRSLAVKGVRDFVFLIGYMGDMIEDHFKSLALSNVNIRFSQEHTPLGTGGAVKHAQALATDPTLLVNGDTFFDGDPATLWRLHADKRAEVTLSLLPVPDVSRYGSVTLDRDGRVTGFVEKKEAAQGPGLINAGLSLLSREFIRKLPSGRGFSMEQEVFPQTAQSGQMVGLCQERPFFDIGTPVSYDAFKSFVREQKALFDGW